MAPVQGPTVRHRRLARELRKRREQAALTPERAASLLGWSRPKLVAIETAKARPRIQDVEVMLDLYGGDAPSRLALVQLARDIRKRGWWSSYDDVLPGSFMELENDAVEIRSWQTQVVPGLLQTDDYALTLIRGVNPHEDEDAHLRRLAVRVTRRTLLSRINAPTLHAVVDEAVLHRDLGSREVMRRQLLALIESAERPNVHLRVVPASAPAHPGTDGSFVLLTFDGPLDLDVGYLEGAVGVSAYLEDVEQVRRCSDTFDRILEVALSEQESLALIRDIAKG
ncbi:transcriptional regulator [Actinomadura sp. NBRC 104425]|uniref:helix-turn-helix domain-containing protein n=1 Tax=Actinomadura sp. NBRC 104425 TaxID=3032204 RepID=UPI0024A48FBB|nr:helix-turn-helix transcriptional regulator [Actinomadura sp. NBRC 104425]GLZ10348.1 transcriptional regulator [Actinomadura sp. NBRC 104425]